MPLARSAAGDGPHAFALQIDVEDGEVEAVGLDHGERLGHAFARPAHAMAERLDKVLEHHGDERFVFDDEDDSVGRSRQAE